MEEKKLVPKLRFPGFTEPWEQRKLGEYAYFRRGSFPQPYGNKEWYDGVGSAPFVQVVDVGDNLSLVDCTKQRISKLAQPMSVYAEKGSVLVTLQGSIGRVAVSQYDAFIDRTILIFQGYKYKTNPYFWAYIINNKFSEEALKAPGGTIKTITKESLSNFIILYPKFSEQEQIGSFLEKLDKLITLHQRKLEHLKLKKKSLLQKLFPKEGEVYPELRFPGFTDPWEQRKLGDVVKRESETQVSSTEYPAIEYEDVIPETGQLNKDIYKKDVQKVGILFDANKVLYGKLRPYLHNWVAPMYTGVAVGDWWVLNPCGLDRGFLYTLIQTVKFDTIANQSAGSKMPRADWKLLSTTEFSIPSLDEQIKIGKLVEGLNDYITLHQRKLEHLQLLKKALLQQLFV